MAQTIHRLRDRRQVNVWVLLLGVVLVLGSLLASGWALSQDDFITGTAVLIYVIAGGLLAGVGLSWEYPRTQ